MLALDYTQSLLNLQEVIVKKVTTNDKSAVIDIEMRKKQHACPRCSAETSYVHDYRTRLIKDIPAFGMKIILNYRLRRYVCPHCGKRFAEEHPFVPKYHRMTSRLVAHIFEKLRSEYSFTSVAGELNLSVSTIIRVFDFLAISRPKKLPRVFAIDEFKGNTGKEKYQAIITDPASKRVLDILPCRSQAELITYLKQWNTKERKRVKYFVSDMWQPYSDIASAFFKNSVQIVDRYHFIRQMVWAFEKVRKRIQKQYGKEYPLLFKHSRKLLIKAIMDKLSSPILSIPGISYRMGAMIIAEIGDFDNFSSPDKILAYAGLSPSTYQSGQMQNCYSHMEKRGSRYLRYALFNATIFVCRWDSSFGEYLAKKQGEGKHYYVAVSHAAKKLVRLICHIEKTGESFKSA